MSFPHCLSIWGSCLRQNYGYYIVWEDGVPRTVEGRHWLATCGVYCVMSPADGTFWAEVEIVSNPMREYGCVPIMLGVYHGWVSQ